MKKASEAGGDRTVGGRRDLCSYCCCSVDSSITGEVQSARASAATHLEAGVDLPAHRLRVRRVHFHATACWTAQLRRQSA